MNNDELKIFTNQSNFESTKVALVGPEGNADAIGSTIQIHFKEQDRVQSFEVAAGGGYLSQSSAAVRMPTSQLKDIEKISIRWPDGSMSEKTPDPESSQIQFQFQSQSDAK